MPCWPRKTQGTTLVAEESSTAERTAEGGPTCFTRACRNEKLSAAATALGARSTRKDTEARPRVGARGGGVWVERKVGGGGGAFTFALSQDRCLVCMVSEHVSLSHAADKPIFLRLSTQHVFCFSCGFVLGRGVFYLNTNSILGKGRQRRKWLKQRNATALLGHIAPHQPSAVPG